MAISGTNPPSSTGAVCTISTLAYLPMVRVLMESLRELHPELARFVLLVDRPDGELVPACAEWCTVIPVESLPVPGLRQMLFRYSPLEMCCAMKPWLAAALLERGFSRICYFDTDIQVFGRLEAALTLLDQGRMLVLTPHLAMPTPGDAAAEQRILLSGVYNMGFFALADHPQARCFLEWWQRRLEFLCVVDPPQGLLADQRWMDLAPGLFPDVAILRQPGYNVAYWNLAERRLANRAGRWEVDGGPLAFFHFSGFDPAQPQNLSRHDAAAGAAERVAVRPLLADYARRLLEHGWWRAQKMPYAYGAFADGTEIDRWCRKAYRQQAWLAAAVGGDPFADARCFFDRPVPEDRHPDPLPLTAVLLQIWEENPRLWKLFPRVPAGERRGFCEWLVADDSRDLGIAEAGRERVRQRLAQSAAARPASLVSRLSRALLALKPWLRRWLPRAWQLRLKQHEAGLWTRACPEAPPAAPPADRGGPTA